MEVRLRPTALNDLAHIIDYVSKENPAASIHIVDQIEAFCLTTFSQNSQTGSLQNEIMQDLRIFPILGYRVCYYIRKDYIDVVRVLHYARNVVRHLREQTSR